ncbi:MAG: PHP domain-containing protein [Bryobacteraceae bacterium]
MRSTKRTFAVRAAAAVCLVLGLAAALAPGRAVQAPPKKWYKGNLHTHTTNSDGDSPPDVVAAWYKDHGYQFLVLSDHNVFTEVAKLNDTFGAEEKFLLIPGEEVTDKFGTTPVHVNGYGLASLVKPAGGDSLVATIQRNVDAIREAQGLPSVNHPNFRWAFGSRELLQVERLSLIEVYNGHPLVYNRGGGGVESLEEMWDALLSAGKVTYGIAVDDAHVFKTMTKDLANPGRGWVMVRATSLSPANIIAALRSGDFYASTGVELASIERTENELRITIDPSPNPYTDQKFTTTFLGEGGRVLGKSFETTPVYQFKGGEKYVRAVVRASNGDDAWTQPMFAPAAGGD